MSNTTSRHRPLVRFAAGLAAAAAVMVPTLADAGAASAGGFDKPVIELPSNNPTIGLPTITPKIDVKPVTVPLPCVSWWCSKPSIFKQPDYVASTDYINSVPSEYKGIPATPYYVRIRNEGFSHSGEVYSTLAVSGEQILAVEGVHASYPDLSAAPVSETATRSAPVADQHLDDAWILHDNNGYDINTQYLRVWVTGNGDAHLYLGVNEHVGVDLLGTLGLDNYRQVELTRTNNSVSFTV